MFSSWYSFTLRLLYVSQFKWKWVWLSIFFGNRIHKLYCLLEYFGICMIWSLLEKFLFSFWLILILLKLISTLSHTCCHFHVVAILDTYMFSIQALSVVLHKNTFTGAINKIVLDRFHKNEFFPIPDPVSKKKSQFILTKGQ